MPVARLVRHPTVFDAGYAHAALVPPGSRLVILAGACPLDESGAVVAPGDLAGQTGACVRTMTEALAAAGAELEDVVSTRLLVASAERRDLGVVWAAAREAFGGHAPPSTLLGVTVLGYEHQLVEIEAVAAVAI